jgi:hypothetical protein
LLLRGEKVMLDADLAALYGVETKQLIRAVKRNKDRFPNDFTFQLTLGEFTILKSHLEASNPGESSVSSAQRHGGRRSRPYVFTEQGIAMLSSVLHSPRAIAVNIEIMRAFVRLRQLLASHADLARRLNEIESKFDKQFAVVFDAIRNLMEPPQEPRREMGYHTLVPKKR